MTTMQTKIAGIAENADRLDAFVNDYGNYVTSQDVPVETLPTFMGRISLYLTDKIASLEESASKAAVIAAKAAEEAKSSEESAADSASKAQISQDKAQLHAVRLESNMIAVIDGYLSRLFPQGSFLDIFNAEGMDLNDPSLTNSPFTNERLINGAFSLSIGDGQVIDLMKTEKDV